MLAHPHRGVAPVAQPFILTVSGNGLHINLSDFTVSLLPEQSDRILSMKDGTLGASELYVLDRWRLATLAVPAGYVAAIATDGKYERLRNWLYPAMWVG